MNAPDKARQLAARHRQSDRDRRAAMLERSSKEVGARRSSDLPLQ